MPRWRCEVVHGRSSRSRRIGPQRSRATPLGRWGKGLDCRCPLVRPRLRVVVARVGEGLLGGGSAALGSCGARLAGASVFRCASTLRAPSCHRWQHSSARNARVAGATASSAVRFCTEKEARPGLQLLCCLRWGPCSRATAGRAAGAAALMRPRGASRFMDGGRLLLAGAPHALVLRAVRPWTGSASASPLALPSRDMGRARYGYCAGGDGEWRLRCTAVCRTRWCQSRPACLPALVGPCSGGCPRLDGTPGELPGLPRRPWRPGRRDFGVRPGALGARRILVESTFRASLPDALRVPSPCCGPAAPWPWRGRRAPSPFR